MYYFLFVSYFLRHHFAISSFSKSSLTMFWTHFSEFTEYYMCIQFANPWQVLNIPALKVYIEFCMPIVTCYMIAFLWTMTHLGVWLYDCYLLSMWACGLKPCISKLDHQSLNLMVLKLGILFLLSGDRFGCQVHCSSTAGYWLLPFRKLIGSIDRS